MKPPYRPDRLPDAYFMDEPEDPTPGRARFDDDDVLVPTRGFERVLEIERDRWEDEDRL